MKSSKPFIMILLAVLVVLTAWSVQGSELVPQTLLSEKSPFSQPSPVLGTDYHPPTSVGAYRFKDGDDGLFTIRRSFYRFFWDTSGRIKDTTAKHGMVDLTHTFGPATPHIYLAHQNAKDYNDWKVGDDDITRMMYGVSIDYKVTDAFYVIPVFTYYDWNKKQEVASKPDINKEWIGGLQFRFIF